MAKAPENPNPSPKRQYGACKIEAPGSDTDGVPSDKPDPRDLQARAASRMLIAREGGFAMKDLHGSALVSLSAIALMACTTSSLAEEKPSVAEPRPALLIDSGEGAPIDFPLHPTIRLAAADSNAAGLSLFEVEIPANSAGAPPHTHTHEDEFFYVRAGTVTFMADGVQKTISPGGLVMLPRGGTHAMWNAGSESATLLVGTSQGAFDDFFDAVAMEVAAAGDLTPPEIGAIVGRIGAERGILIDMSLVPDDVRPLYGMPPME